MVELRSTLPVAPLMQFVPDGSPAYRTGAQAQETTLRGAAEAQATTATGLAHAEAVKARGLAEAAGIEARAQALAENQEAVIAQQITANYPRIVRPAPPRWAASTTWAFPTAPRAWRTSSARL